MKLGVIGTSWISEDFINGCKINGNLRFTAVYSRSREKGRQFCRKLDGEQVFTDIDKLAACDEIDCVYIASPNIYHYPQAKLMLENKKHVICEKPVAMTAAQLDELYQLACKNDLIFIEAMKPLYIKERDILKSAVAKIGKISSARLDFSQLSSKYSAFIGGELPNIFNPEMGAGCLMDLGCYPISLAIDLFGAPKSILSEAKLLSSGADISGSAIFNFSNPNDFFATLTYSKSGQSMVPSEIIGDNGTITLTSLTSLSNITLYLKNEKSGGYDKSILSGEKSGAEVMSGEAEAFYDMILSKKNPQADKSSLNEANLSSGRSSKNIMYELYSHSRAVLSAMEKIRSDNGIKLALNLR